MFAGVVMFVAGLGLFVVGILWPVAGRGPVTRRAVLQGVGIVVVAVVVVVRAAFLVAAADRRDDLRDCRAAGGDHTVSTGRGHVCVTPDGRVIG